MSSVTPQCVYCSKECKLSDSKPFPNSKSKDRIHNRCQIKKTLASKQKESNPIDNTALNERFVANSEVKSTFAASLTTPSKNLVERVIEENEARQRAAKLEKLNKIISDKEAQSSSGGNGGFFFDVKAGIAKPHETRKYLNHRKICEIAPRYNDHGYQEEAIGRSYDHTGKDLDTLGDQSDDDSQAEPSIIRKEGSDKRKSTHLDDSQGHRKKRESNIQIGVKNPCWFCLSSPEVDKSLIIAIGDYCYLTLAKGGLVDEHLLLIPIEHIESVNNSANTKELLSELESFKNSLILFFDSQSKGVIFYERNFRSVHWQIHVVPVSLDDLDNLSDKIKTISKVHFTKSEYVDIPKNCSLADIVPPSAPYLYWQIEPLKQKFVFQINVKDTFFPVQLPRIVLADEQIMNCPDRIDWKSCSKSKNEYIDLAKQISNDYSEFNIT